LKQDRLDETGRTNLAKDPEVPEPYEADADIFLAAAISCSEH
jgi:hypothetical protein